MAKKSMTAYVVSWVPWTRELHRPFQELRVQFVSNVDAVLRAIEAEELSAFALDSQTILIGDYLEVRPEQRATIEDLLRSSRLSVGPWYVRPHQLLVSPEALVRNLLIGHQDLAYLGGQTNIAYLVAQSGHIGQLPQILNGFGINYVVSTAPGTAMYEQFQWASGDDSRVKLVTLPPQFLVESGKNVDRKLSAADLSRFLEEARKDQVRATTFLLFDAVAPGVPSDIESIIGHIKGLTVVHGSLHGFSNIIDQDREDAPVAVGEVMAAYGLGARPELKQLNHSVQTLLVRWAEPYSVWARLAGTASGQYLRDGTGRDLNSRLIDLAWRFTLQSQGEATLAGCTSDPVSREAMFRLDQANQIGNCVVDMALQTLAGRIDTRKLVKSSQMAGLIVFNPAGSRNIDAVEIEIVLPEGAESLVVTDLAGKRQRTALVKPFVERAGDELASRRRQLRIIAEGVPPVGYSTFGISWIKEASTVSEEGHRVDLENEFLTVSVNPSDGTLHLFDKRSGRSFDGLNRFVDGGDTGPVENYEGPLKETVIDIATNTPISVDRIVTECGQSLSFLQIYRLPSQLVPARNARLPLAAQFVPISIMTRVELIVGVPRADINVMLTNGALDHRLQAYFPTGIIDPDVYVDGSFEICNRTGGLSGSGAAEMAQQGFVTLIGSDTGITIANRGIHDLNLIEVDQQVVVALTLMRSVGWARGAGGKQAAFSASKIIHTPGAQSIGEYEFSYSLIPHGSDPTAAWAEARAFQSPMKGILTTRHSGTLSPSDSLVAVDDPRLVLSAVKPAADGQGFIVRVFNQSEEAISTTIRFGGAIKEVRKVLMDEVTKIGRLHAKTPEQYALESRCKEITTLRVIPEATQ